MFQDQPVGYRRDGRVARPLEKWFLSIYLGKRAWQIPSEQYTQSIERGVTRHQDRTELLWIELWLAFAVANELQVFAIIVAW